MATDPIVNEVREQRKAILASFDGDFETMSRDAMQRQWNSGHRVVSHSRPVSPRDAVPQGDASDRDR